MTDHHQAAVEALASEIWRIVQQYPPHFSMDVLAVPILDIIAQLLTAPLQAELDAAYAEAHACGAERETWKDRAEAAEAKLARAVGALTGIADQSLGDEIPPGYGPDMTDGTEFHRGYDSAIRVARAVLSAINGEPK